MKTGWTALFVAAALWPLAAPAADAADAPCYECHDKEPLTSGNVHPPVADGECEACHLDHGDQEKLILVEPVPALCFQCHDELSKPHKHPPAEDGECLSCHRVHSSPVRRLLQRAVPALCEECHDPFAGEVVHAPVEEGSCGECHDPHDSDTGALLTRGYDRERYVEFSEEAYALCFECHDAEGFSNPDAEGRTGFRRGGQNLHYVHVYDREEDPETTLRRSKKRRMSCNGCHLPHVSLQPHLIRKGMTKGKMTIYTIEHTRSEGGGGRCVVGCHKPQEYGPEAGRQSGLPVVPDGRVLAGSGGPASKGN